MKIYYEIPDNKELFHNPVITIGSFDGVHTGHRRILSTLLNIAREKSGDAIVLTFSTHPRKILSPRTPPKILTTAEEKIRVIRNCDIKIVIMLEFTEEMANMSAVDFLNEIILKKLGVIDIVIGYDHAFGKDREGNFELLKEFSRKRGFKVTRAESKDYYSRPVSSSWIRTELEDGNIGLANKLLGRRYSITGDVVHGFSRGRSIIGFPTANILPDEQDKVIPKDGVYAVSVEVDKSLRGKGMLNIGTNPTFSNTERSIEVHIFDFDRDIYGSRVDIEFHERIRDEIRFESSVLLVEQLKRDKTTALEILDREALYDGGNPLRGIWEPG
jgi:riboflavin kinase/FMN adenylyltransferase